MDVHIAHTKCKHTPAHWFLAIKHSFRCESRCCHCRCFFLLSVSFHSLHSICMARFRLCFCVNTQRLEYMFYGFTLLHRSFLISFRFARLPSSSSSLAISYCRWFTHHGRWYAILSSLVRLTLVPICRATMFLWMCSMCVVCVCRLIASSCFRCFRSFWLCYVAGFCRIPMAFIRSFLILFLHTQHTMQVKQTNKQTKNSPKYPLSDGSNKSVEKEKAGNCRPSKNNSSSSRVHHTMPEYDNRKVYA